MCVVLNQGVDLFLPSIGMRAGALPRELDPLLLGRFPDVVDLLAEVHVALLE